jgi:hypothetical protein
MVAAATDATASFLNGVIVILLSSAEAKPANALVNQPCNVPIVPELWLNLPLSSARRGGGMIAFRTAPEKPEKRFGNRAARRSILS